MSLVLDNSSVPMFDKINIHCSTTGSFPGLVIWSEYWNVTWHVVSNMYQKWSLVTVSEVMSYV